MRRREAKPNNPTTPTTSMRLSYDPLSSPFLSIMPTSTSTTTSTPTPPTTPSNHSQSFNRCRFLYATQSGRAKACARRVERVVRTHCPTLQVAAAPTSLDQAVAATAASAPSSSLTTTDSSSLVEAMVESQWNQSDTLLILFVSTTGDGESPDSMTVTWKTLLRKSLPKTFLQGCTFMLFNLGDRAYGPQFCAAGRRLAVRFMQLGAKLLGQPGYGDDGTPGGGCLRDLDTWMEKELQMGLQNAGLWSKQQSYNDDTSSLNLIIPHQIKMLQNMHEHHHQHQQQQQTSASSTSFTSLEHLDSFFQTCAPLTAYSYENNDNKNNNNKRPLTGTITTNQRLTATDWEQDTRHLTIEIPLPNNKNSDSAQPPYQAGDVVAILPVNSTRAVDRFLEVLPAELQQVQDEWMDIAYNKNQQEQQSNALVVGVGYPSWPQTTTLRQWLTYCADIAALPEREDLWALSHYCSPLHSAGAAQAEKLQSLSDTTASALYTDYILRNKRGWTDVLHDFDALRSEGSRLTLQALVSLLAPIRPREFSIASAPTTCVSHETNTFTMDLTVAVVEGTTPLGRPYHGLCSHYLASCSESDTLRLWIRPGSFHHLPARNANVPVLYMGAGTGIAPLRGLIRERVAHYKNENNPSAPTNDETKTPSNQWTTPDILLFGCRKETTDFYYREEWKQMLEQGTLTLMTAFSRDQWHKFYVQQRLRQADLQGEKLLHHFVNAAGHLYIAGGAKMARALKQEIVELLEPHLGGEDRVTKYLAQLQRAGRFRVEAWS